MKTKIWNCCAAALTILALSPGLAVQGMARTINLSEQMFGSNFGFMQGVYGASGAKVILELWNHRSQVEM